MACFIKEVFLTLVMMGMRVEVRKLTDKEIVLKLHGEDHTLGNLVAKLALRHPNVTMAAYQIEHPLEGSPIIRIVTDGSKDALEVLREVLREAIDYVDAVIQEIERKVMPEARRSS